MREDSFLQSENLVALKYLVAWEKAQIRSVSRGESTDTSFFVRIGHYDSDERYYQEMFLRPSVKGVYLLSKTRETFNNVRVVPKIVEDYVAKKSTEFGLKIMKLEPEIDGIKTSSLSKGEENRIGFCFWVVKFIPFRQLTTDIFDKEMNDYINKADKIVDGFEAIYLRSY